MQRCLVHWVRSAKKPSGFPADRGTGIAWHGVAWRAGVMRVRYPHTRGEKEKEGGGGCPGKLVQHGLPRPATRISWIHDPRRSLSCVVSHCRWYPRRVRVDTTFGASRGAVRATTFLSPSSTLPLQSPSLSARTVYVTMSLPGRTATCIAVRLAC